MSNITKNLLYNILFQIVNMALPLITVPYVSRVLGTSGVGTYSYTYSITQYFVIIGTIGLNIYGNRQIAYTRDSTEDLSRTFWSLLILRVITTSITMAFYAIIFWDNETYSETFIIQTFVILAAMVDISWLFMGLEDFKKIVTRNLIVKILGVCLTFLIVKDSRDLNLYVWINALTLLFGNLVMWVYIPKDIKLIHFKLENMMYHLIPSIQLFLPQISSQVYLLLDKSLLGFLANVEEVGLYAQAEKLIKVGLAIITALGTVMMPRMSNMFANGDKQTMIKYFNISLKGVAYVAVPMSFGIAGVANEFVPWFLGAEFVHATYLMIYLSPILFLISMSNVMGTQYLIPSNRVKEFTVSITAGAIVNVVLNLILIPSLKAVGTCIATIAAEFTVTAIMYFFLRKNVHIKSYIQGLTKYVFAGAIMFVSVRVIGIIAGNGVLTTVIQCFIGIVLYFIMLRLTKESVNEKAFEKVIGRFQRILSRM